MKSVAISVYDSDNATIRTIKYHLPFRVRGRQHLVVCNPKGGNWF